MKKALSLMSFLLVSVCAFGCSTNGLECDEANFHQTCIDSGTLEICTTGERAQFICSKGWKCEDDEEEGASCVEK